MTSVKVKYNVVHFCSVQIPVHVTSDTLCLCEDPETIGLEVACWLQDSQLLDVMSRKAMKVGHPHAAEEIAMDIGETTLSWMERNEQKQHP